jgi:pyridoxine 5-phosphate synthase
MAVSEEMVKIALDLKPDAVTLVPENPNEVTTTGGLNITGNTSMIRAAVNRLREAGILTSAFIDPDEQQIEAAQSVGVQQIELCTGEYAELTQRTGNSEHSMRAAHEINRHHTAAIHAGQYGLRIAAGHGLTYRNIAAIAAISEITEFNIGHNIIARSIFVGLNQAVREMLAAIRQR